MRLRRLRRLLLLVLAPIAISVIAAPGSAAQNDGPYLYTVARLLASDGELEAAEAAFRDAIAADPTAAFPRIEYADLLLRLQRVEEALEQAERALELAPRDAVVLSAYGQLQIAVARRDSRALERAQRALETLREVDPSDLPGMVTLGQIYQTFGRHADAVVVYEEILRRHNDNRQLKRLLIDALQQAGEEDRAKELLEELIRLDQETLESRLALAQLESERGNHGAAIEILEQAGPEGERPRVQMLLAREYVLRAQAPGLSRERRDSDLSRALEIYDHLLDESFDPAFAGGKARVLAMRGDLESAAGVLEAARQQAPEDPRSTLQLAGIRERQGRADDAVALLQSLLGRVGEDRAGLKAEVERRLVGLEARRGNWSEVVRLTRAILAGTDVADRAEVVGLQAEAWVQLDKPQKALELLRKEEREHGPSPRLLLGRADLLATLGRTAEALAVLDHEALQKADEDEIVLSRVRSFLLLDRVDRAVSLLRDLAGDEFEGLLRAGQFLSLQGRFNEAIPFLEDALAAAEMAGADTQVRADAHFFLGQALERTGSIAAAAEQFQKVLEIRADDSMAMNYLGYMWADEGIHLEEALALVERAVELEPANGAYRDSLGWAQYRLGNLEGARENLTRATALTPDNATIYLHLGDVLLALGDEAAAREAYERALALDDPEHSEELRAKLDQLDGGEL